MEERLKQRLVGAGVLVAIAVVFVPILLDTPPEEHEAATTTSIVEIPERSRGRFGSESSASISLDEPETSRLDAEIERERSRRMSSMDAADGDRSSETSARASTDAASEAPAPAPIVSEAPGAGSSSARSEPAPGGRRPDASPAKKQAVETPVAVTGGWMVQLGSFRKAENARALRKRLQSAGYPAFVELDSSGRSELSRVLIGPVPGRAQAKDIAAKLEREMKIEGILVHHPGG